MTRYVHFETKTRITISTNNTFYHVRENTTEFNLHYKINLEGLVTRSSRDLHNVYPVFMTKGIKGPNSPHLTVLEDPTSEKVVLLDKWGPTDMVTMIRWS